MVRDCGSQLEKKPGKTTEEKTAEGNWEVTGEDDLGKRLEKTTGDETGEDIAGKG